MLVIVSAISGGVAAAAAGASIFRSTIPTLVIMIGIIAAVSSWFFVSSSAPIFLGNPLTALIGTISLSGFSGAVAALISGQFIRLIRGQNR